MTTNYLLSKWSKPNLNLMKRNIFEQYVSAVSQRFDVPKEELFSKKKHRHLVDARHMLYYLCAKRPMNISYIQMYMADSGYDICHSSIIHGIKKVTQQVEADQDYQSLISDINNHLSS